MWVYGAKPLTKIEGLKLVPNSSNDGDSFHVTDGKEKYFLRLYLVDTPETSAGDDAMAKRVREQTRYFGLPDYSMTVAFGKKAAEFTKQQLSEPFVVYTAFSLAGGRSSVSRYYAFVVTAKQERLDELLVKNGMARAYGLSRDDHEGVSGDELRARLADFEASAMLSRQGIWKFSNAEKIAELRALERQELGELSKISAAVAQRSSDSKINMNTASFEDLQLLKGVGEATAKRIIEGRPYKDLDSLRNIKGITSKTIDSMKDQVEF